jgi:aspartate 1-decarboxylase
MEITVLKSKIHRVRVTEANLDYIGSVTIDENLIDAANLIENEQVHIFNYRNGERFITYVIKGARGSGVICLNGPAALKVSLDDEIIIVSYAQMDFEAAKKFQPSVVFPEKGTNRLKS